MSIVLDGSNTNTIGIPNLGTAKASTSGTAINFTGIPSGVKRITIILDLVSTSGTNALLVQIGPSGGVVTSGYNSVSWTAAANYNGTSNGFSLNNNVGAANTYSGTVTLVNISGNNWVESSVINCSSSGGAAVGAVGTGRVGLSGPLSIVSVTTQTGSDTFDAGSINILYE